MNSSKHGSSRNQSNGDLYIIEYIKGDRRLRDCARSMDGAKARITARLAKRHNKGERAEVYRNHTLVFSTQS